MATEIQSPSDDKSVGSYYTPDEDTLSIGGWGDFYLFGIKFDISSLPADVTSAKVYLYLRDDGHASPLTSTRWRRIEQDWSESTLTYANKPTGMINNSGTLVDLPDENNWFELDITTLYNQWKAETYDNYGIAINGNKSSYNANLTKFYSKEYITDPDKRPYLEITYTPPATASFLLMM